MNARTTSVVDEALRAVLADASRVVSGEVATYIPELAEADPDHFGIAVVSVGGQRYAAGDAHVPFTIQSISKPFVYGLALSEHGLDEVSRHVGFEPSGEPFNAISLDPASGRPANPMINAGAIVTSSLVPGTTPAARFERILAVLAAAAGRDLTVDESVFESELATGDRNRALGYLARATGVLGHAVADATEVYFRQCSVLVTAEDIAVMGATLAHGGVNPCTGVEVFDERVARHVLSLMASCGMYDDAGEWMVRVGLPAKSGVGGGIVAASPGHFGIGVFSPRLDEKGNSARGVAVLEALSDEYGLHMLTHPRELRTPIEVLAPDAGDELLIVVRGEVDFVAAEQIAHRLEHAVHAADPPERVCIDLSAVSVLRPAAERLLASAARDLAQQGVTLIVDDPAGVVSGHEAPDGSRL